MSNTVHVFVLKRMTYTFSNQFSSIISELTRFVPCKRKSPQLNLRLTGDFGLPD